MPDKTWRRKCHSGISLAMTKHFIREWREHRGLTQDQAEDLSGIGQSTLARIETGVREYKEHHLIALAKAYGCTPSQLIGDNPYEQDSAEIVDIWGHIPAGQREQAREILKTFTRKKEA